MSAARTGEGALDPQQSPIELAQQHLDKSLTVSPIYTFAMSGVIMHPSTVSGHSISELPLTSSHVNSKGSLHGSVSATIVDWCSGNVLATAGRASGVSVDMHVSFLSAKAKVGDTVRIEAKIDKLGGRLAFISVRILKGDELVVTASHTKYVA